jgi:ABC-type branched-subunit amino acid transport system substrate-binding protein
MSRIANHLLLIGLCFWLSLGSSSACSVETIRPKELKIGVVFALTGQGAYWSDLNLKGIQLAQEDLEKQGRRIKLIVEDSTTDPAGSVKSFNKLVTVDKVDAVIGNIWFYLTAPMIPLAVRSKIILIGPEVDCKAGSPYTFHGGTQLKFLNPAYEKYFDLHPEIRSTAVVNFDDTGWGHRQRDAWISAAKNNNVSISGHVETSELLPDFKSIFLKLLKNKPDTVFVAHEPHSSVKALKMLQYHGGLVQSNAVYEALVSAHGSMKEFEGVYYADSAPSRDFAERFEKKFELPPVLEPHKSYEILVSLVKAFDINPVNPHLGMSKVKYQGVSGPIDYTSGCAGNHSKWHLFQVKNGRPFILK